MEATSGTLIASTSRYPLSFDHRSITLYPFHDTRRTYKPKALILTTQSQYPILFRRGVKRNLALCGFGGFLALSITETRLTGTHFAFVRKDVEGLYESEELKSEFWEIGLEVP